MKRIGLFLSGLILSLGVWSDPGFALGERDQLSAPAGDRFGTIGATPALQPSFTASSNVEIVAGYGKLPLSFEANLGQTDSRVKFLSRGRGYNLFLTSSEAVLVLHKGQAGSASPAKDTVATPEPSVETAGSAVVRMRMTGGNPDPEIVGLEELEGRSNYFVGGDPKQWRTDIRQYRRVRYEGVYPGVDMVLYGNDGSLEFDFVVAAGADPDSILLEFDNADALSVGGNGDLVLEVGGESVLLKAPLVYQEIADAREAVAGRYVLKAQDKVGFELAAYDDSRPIVIDPVLVYSTYLGGSGVFDVAGEIAVDAAGNAYVEGLTDSADFPVTDATFLIAALDTFVTKLNPAGTGIVYSTYIGGSTFEDDASAIALGADGSVYLGGTTRSTDFPVTPGAFQTTHGGGLQDIFVAKLDSLGVLEYATYLGGGAAEQTQDIEVNANGEAFVTGLGRPGFPTTPGSLQPSFAGGSADAIVAKLNATGTALIYSTFLGGSGEEQALGLAIDADGNAYVSGSTRSTDFPMLDAIQPLYGGGSSDGFVTKINPQGSTILYSTFLGGSAGEEGGGQGIAVDADRSMYIVGSTPSTDFPTANAFQPSFSGGIVDSSITKLSADGQTLVYSTYFGGVGTVDSSQNVAADADGNAYVSGITNSNDLPLINPIQAAYGGGSLDAYVLKLDPVGNPVFLTYLGGGGREEAQGIAVDASGDLYVSGRTNSADFPVTPGVFQTTLNGSALDAFVLKIGGIGPTGLDLVCELKVKDTTAKSFHLETFNADPELLDTWTSLFGVAPGPGMGDLVTLQAPDRLVTWAAGTLEMDGVMRVEVKTDPMDPSIKQVKIEKAGKFQPPPEFLLAAGGLNPNLADGGWHEVKIKNLDGVTVIFGGDTITGFLKELKVKLDEDGTTALPIVKDFKVVIKGSTAAADVPKGTVMSMSVGVAAPATVITALADTDYEEKIKVKPEAVLGHTEAEFKRPKDTVTEGADVTSLLDGFNDKLKERKGPCTVEEQAGEPPTNGCPPNCGL